MITKKYKTPLYGTEFTVIIYNSNEEFIKKYPDLEIENFDGAVFWREDKLYIVFSAEKKDYPTPGIIAHESKHLVNNIFIQINHKLSRWNDEPEAYLLGWIVNRIHEILPK